MYIPPYFKNENIQELHDLMRRYNFGFLTSTGHDGLNATHLPFLIDPDRGQYGTLIGHMARANPHWKTLGEEKESLIIFQGRHAYISPAWYEDQNTVPTWNYAAVHAYGKAEIIEDADRLYDMTNALVDYHEAGIGTPWDKSQAKETMQKSVKAIVGFEIPIDRLEGKFKFNQNKSANDQMKVAGVFEKSEDPMIREVSNIMYRNAKSMEGRT